jgi:hypothetical protein
LWQQHRKGRKRERRDGRGERRASALPKKSGRGVYTKGCPNERSAKE